MSRKILIGSLLLLLLIGCSPLQEAECFRSLKFNGQVDTELVVGGYWKNLTFSDGAGEFQHKLMCCTKQEKNSMVCLEIE